MDMEFRQDGQLLVCELIGQLESQAAIELHKEVGSLQEAEQNHCVIDLSGVSFIDSSGIGALVYAHKRLKEVGKRLMFVAVSGQPAEMLSFLRVDKVVPVYPDFDSLKSKEGL